VPEPLDDARDAISFIDASPSPYHAAAEVARRLTDAGFVEVAERDAWTGEAGGRFLRRGGSLVAWVNGSGIPRSFRILGAHTDSPNLRVKPRPDLSSAGWRQLGVEIYGGALLNSWLDRDLGLSGRVGVLGPDGSDVRLFRDDRPLLRVPQLAIHLDREINQAGLKLNPQLHLTPTWGLGSADAGSFVRYLAARIGAEEGSIVSWDVMAHDITPGAIAGIDQELLSSARLDDLLSCWAATAAMTATVAEGGSDQTMPVIALFDHEEVGSSSSSGAAGDVLATTLERVVRSQGGDGDDLARALAGSRLVSTDGAHATHPNYAERHDPNHVVSLNGGPVLKHNANARYATDTVTAAWFEQVCRRVEVPVQHFVSRNDMPCGSTIGPITATRLGVATVDVGAAQLAMHSARELSGSRDPQLLRLALTACLEG
jgi:aspartyl aminopeptidase